MSYVVAIGGANLDINAQPNSAVLALDSMTGTISTSFGGVARNIAENLARLHLDCHLLSAVGEDTSGLALLQHTERAGVKVDEVLRVAGTRTGMYVSINDAQGDLSIAVNDMAVLEHLTAAYLREKQALLKQAALIIADTNLSQACLTALFEQAGQIPVFIDTVSVQKASKIRAHLANIHTLKPNRLEAEYLSGMSLDHDAAAPAVASWFLDQGVTNIVLSLGERGLYCADRQAQVWLKPLSVAVCNTSGAGDALMSGLVYGYLSGYSLCQAARFAQGCAALTLGVAQANCPNLSPAAVMQLLSVHDANNSLGLL
ncbi:PfkB family carbohydrate kinase [Thiolinea disciformis]|uniref:PfkB family carbohydrate kinase n=1 Tax=Thiolinea disciformis TaxID=125614 RepID=UPI00035C0B03|nr:PfkB family carbohydrate kinase [Thiolinea disciformis]